MGILSVVLGHQVDSLFVNIAFFCNYLPCDLQMNGTIVGACVIRL